MAGYPPLQAMLEVVAIAARAGEPRPVVPVVHAGTPADDAASALAAGIDRHRARMAAEIKRQVGVVEGMIFDGVPVTSPKDKGES